MNRLILIILLLLPFASVANGAPSAPLFVDSASQDLAPPPADKAQIVFLEPFHSFLATAATGLFEMADDNRTPLATTGSRTRVVVLFTPGHHLLMSNTSGLAAHFLDMNVDAGKRYYVLLRFIDGHGFQLRPLRPSGPSDYTVANKEFPGWIATTRFVDKTPDSDAYFEKYKDLITRAQVAGWKSWLAKTPEERAELTLNPEDSIAP